MSDFTDWIDVDPPQGEIMGEPGKEYLPIFIVETQLRKYDPYWSTENFRYRLYPWNTSSVSNLAALASGSLELVVSPPGSLGRIRRLVGAATLIVPDAVDLSDPDVNSNFEATVKSECIKNAAKVIGRAFGWSLNDRDIISTRQTEAPRTGKRKPDPTEMKPDAKSQEDYNRAYDLMDSKKMKALKAIYPSIEYTGKFIRNAEARMDIRSEG